MQKTAAEINRDDDGGEVNVSDDDIIEEASVGVKRGNEGADTEFKQIEEEAVKIKRPRNE